MEDWYNLTICLSEPEFSDYRNWIICHKIGTEIPERENEAV